jgi:hypothetical protein
MTKILDYAGTSVSWLCLIHCLAMPLLITTLSVVGLGFLADESTEFIIIGISICLALLSFVPSFFRHHHKLKPLILFGFGISLIIFSHLVFEENLLGKVVFLIGGAILISSAHLLNHSYCKNCKEH